MQEIFVACLCTGLFVGACAAGIGITLLLERWLGLWAYLFGLLAPLIVVGGLLISYDLALRVIVCEPAESLACGEPAAAALAVLVTLLCFVLLANLSAQVALYLFLYARRETAGLRRAQQTDPATAQ